MPNEEYVMVALQNIIESEEHICFYKNYISSHDIQTSADVDNYFLAFRLHLESLGKLSEDRKISLSIIKEELDEIRHQMSDSQIYLINNSKKLNDDWIADFESELQECLTGESIIKDIKPKKFKTITEHLICHCIDSHKLAALYSKYAKFNHPYVNNIIASALINASNSTDGFAILKEGIKSIASYPNYYWNNESGIDGATWMIGNLIYLLGDGLDINNLRTEKIKLLKILFLYMSRYICMTQSNLYSIDHYSNRARIVKDYHIEFAEIFGPGVNPDIQYISDMYLAYSLSLKNNLSAIPSFQQFMWESLKMYQHGSHIPNSSDGYKEIEDRTWMELVRDGQIRSLILGDNLLKEFEGYELNISNKTIDILFDILDAKITTISSTIKTSQV